MKARPGQKWNEDKTETPIKPVWISCLNVTASFQVFVICFSHANNEWQQKGFSGGTNTNWLLQLCQLCADRRGIMKQRGVTLIIGTNLEKKRDYPFCYSAVSLIRWVSFPLNKKHILIQTTRTNEFSLLHCLCFSSDVLKTRRRSVAVSVMGPN